MNVKDLIVLEWSIAQRCFHRHTVGQMVSHNLRTCLREDKADWLPIGIFDSYAECDDFREKVAKELGYKGMDERFEEVSNG